MCQSSVNDEMMIAMVEWFITACVTGAEVKNVMGESDKCDG